MKGDRMSLIERICPVCGKFSLDENDIETLTEPARINAAFAGRKSGQLADVRQQLAGGRGGVASHRC
jgi:hypothetical protein